MIHSFTKTGKCKILIKNLKSSFCSVNMSWSQFLELPRSNASWEWFMIQVKVNKLLLILSTNIFHLMLVASGDFWNLLRYLCSHQNIIDLASKNLCTHAYVWSKLIFLIEELFHLLNNNSIIKPDFYNLALKSFLPMVEVIYPEGLSTGKKTSSFRSAPPTDFGNLDKSTLK